MATPVLNDLRRDAADVLRTDIAVRVLDIGQEDLPTDDDIHLLKDFEEEDSWMGLFSSETTGEKLFEVRYRYDTEKFYITTYLMLYCAKVDPPHMY